MRGHGYQWISNKINIRHPGQLKKSKSWEPFWSYQDLIFSIVLGADYSFYVKNIETHAQWLFGPEKNSFHYTVMRFQQF